MKSHPTSPQKEAQAARRRAVIAQRGPKAWVMPSHIEPNLKKESLKKAARKPVTPSDFAE